MTYSWIVLKGKQVCVPAEHLQDILKKNVDVVVVDEQLSENEIVKRFFEEEQDLLVKC